MEFFRVSEEAIVAYNSIAEAENQIDPSKPRILDDWYCSECMEGHPVEGEKVGTVTFRHPITEQVQIGTPTRFFLDFNGVGVLVSEGINEGREVVVHVSNLIFPTASGSPS